MTANRESSSDTGSRQSLSFCLPVASPLATAATSSVLVKQFFFFLFPLMLFLSLSLSLSCFLDYTGLRCINSTAFKLPDLNTGLEYTTWQKRGRAGVNHFILYCAVKWRRPWISGHSHFFSTSHLLFMNKLFQLCSGL